MAGGMPVWGNQLDQGAFQLGVTSLALPGLRVHENVQIQGGSWMPCPTWPFMAVAPLYTCPLPCDLVLFRDSHLVETTICLETAAQSPGDAS